MPLLDFPGKCGLFNFDASGLAPIVLFKLFYYNQERFGSNYAIKEFELFLSMENPVFLISEVIHISKIHMGHFQGEMQKKSTQIVKLRTV